MEFLLVLIAAPVTIWILDRLLYRGEFSEAFLEAVRVTRPGAKNTRKVGRGRPPDA
jgi:hypothetical protein